MQEPTRVGAQRPLLADPVLLIMLALGILTVPWFLLGPAGTTSSWLMQTGLDLTLATFAWRLARAAAGKRAARRFWRTVVVTGISCAIGDGFQTVRVILWPAERETSVVQTAFVVAGMVLVVIVMLFHPLGGAGRQRLRLWLDAATVLTAVAVFLWYFSLADVLTSGNATQRYAGAATSAVMLLITFGLLKLVLGENAPFTRSAAIVGAFGVGGTAVGASLAALITGSTDPRLLLVGQMLPCVLAPVSLRMQLVQMRRRPAPEATAQARRRSSRMPYLAVICTLLLMVVALPRLEKDMRVWGVTVGAVLITALVLGRQLAAFHDNERLLTELDRSMLEVNTQREWFSSLVQHSSDVTLVIGADGRVGYASPATSRVLGIDAVELTGTLLGERTHPDDRAQLHDLTARLAAHPGVDADTQLRMRHADGTHRWLDVVGVDLSDNPSVNGIVLNARDVTEARLLHDELRHQATHDTLTGLANRGLFEQRLRALPPAAPISILLIDLDGFKPINDRYGHHAGDEVLVAVARRLGTLTGDDGLAVRLGGDEFAVLSTDPAGAPALAERIATVIAEPIAIPGDEVAVGASVGVGVGLPRDAEQIVRDADAAMYRTKAGRKAGASLAG